MTKTEADRQFREDLRHIISTPQGKRFFKRFLKDCNITRPKFPTDHYTMISFEGKRHLGMSYLNIIAKDKPEDIIQQIQEEQL